MSASPTAQQLFGNTPWITDPNLGGTGPAGHFLWNNTYFATPETAAVVLQIVILGCALKPEDAAKCIVVEDPQAMTGNPVIKQDYPNQMIQMPDGSRHYAGRIALEFQNWPSIESTNAELTQEFGMPFVFVMPPPAAKPAPKPVPGNELLVAPIGGTAMQADGTTWKRVS